MSYEDQLKERVAEIQRALDEDKEIKKARKALTKEERAFRKLPDQADNDFFCDRCQLDFKAPSYKHWVSLYGIGAWISFCPICGVMTCRWITNKANDPYYEKSSKIRGMRSMFEADMLQPDQYGFQTLYGDPFEKYHKILEHQEEEIRTRYLSLGLTGETLQEQSEREKMKEYFKDD